MTNNPTINGVSRELIEQSATLLEAHSSGPSIESNLATDLRTLLDAPAVERQEPTTAMTDAGCQAYMDADGMIGIMHNSSMGHAYTAMRALDPEVAALQSTIAQLQARMKELESGRGEPVGQVVEFGKGLKEVSWIKGRMPKLGEMLFTAPPPPVAVALPERKSDAGREWDSHHTAEVEGWNSCLDATAALNGERK